MITKAGFGKMWRWVWIGVLAVGLLVAPWMGARAEMDAPQAAEAATVTRLSSNIMGITGSASGLVASPVGLNVAYLADKQTDGLNEVFVHGANAQGLNSSSFQGFQLTELTDFPVYLFSPDGNYLVLIGDLSSDGVFELFARSTSSTTTNRISYPAVAGGNVLDFVITPDSSRVIYRGDQDADEVFELYSAPVDGSATAIKISGNVGDNSGDVSSPSGACNLCYAVVGSRVIYIADQDTDQVFELYSVPVTGGSITKLHTNFSGVEDVISFRGNPNGNRVVFLSNKDDDAKFELFSVFTTGGSNTKLNAALVTDGDVDSYALSADNTRVVYLADQITDNMSELFSVSISGGSVTTLSSGISGSEDVTTFAISPTSSRVAYRADGDVDGKFELYTVPLTGGSVVKLPISGGLPADGDINSDFQFTPDGLRVVFTADKTFSANNADELFSALADGSANAVMLSSIPSGAQDVVSYEIRPDSTQVAFRADQDTDAMTELYIISITGGTATKLNEALPASGDVSAFEFSGDGSKVIYLADERFDGLNDLYSISPAGSSKMRISPDLSKREVQDFWLSPDGSRVIYIADQIVDNQFELFSVASDGSGGQLAISGVLSAVQSVNWGFSIPALRMDPLITSDSSTAVFVMRVNAQGFRSLFSNGLTSLNAPILLSDPAHDVLGMALSPDGARAVYVSTLFINGSHQQHLFSVPVNGGTVVQLTPNESEEIILDRVRISADGERVVFMRGKLVPPDNFFSYFEIWSAPLDGSSPAVRLHTVLTPDRSATLRGLTPDGQQALFTADLQSDNVNELYRAPVDGSSPALEISQVGIQASNIIFFVTISPDSRWAAYVFDNGSDDRIYAVNLESPQANGAYLISGSKTGMGLYKFIGINAASSQVLFQVNTSKRELYSAALNPPGEPVLLADISFSGNMEAMLSPDGGRVVYLQEPSGASPAEVFSIGLAGGAATKLNSALPAHADSFFFTDMPGFSPDGARFVSLSDIASDGIFDLYLSPSGGGFYTPVNLTPLAGEVDKYLFSPDGAVVYYRAEQNHIGVAEVYRSVENRSSQTITFVALSDRAMNQLPFNLAATSSSGLAVKFYSASPAICTVSGSAVNAVSPGRCTIVAVQDGNSTFNPAPPVSRSFTLNGQVFLPVITR